MLGHLIRKEILDQILSQRFLILSAIGTLVIWLSLFSGYTYYQESREDYRRAQQATEERIRQIMVADDWREAMSRRPTVNKPPVTLSIFVRGLEPILGRTLSARQAKLSPAEAEPILGMFPALDLGLVVQAVLSLFALLLTYDAICGEKEQGTLRLTMSNAIPRDRLLLAKFTGVLIPALAAFGLPVVAGLAIILLAPQIQISAQEWMRLGIILCTFGIYLAAFTCAGLFSSCLTHRSAPSFIILLTFWTATVIVLPRLSLIVADRFRPAPSVHQYQTERAAISAEAYAWRSDLTKAWFEARSAPGEEWWRTPEGREARQILMTRLRQEADERMRPQYDRLDEAFRNRYASRQNLAVALARTSPAFALNNAVTLLAGTGVDRHQEFLETFTRYNERFFKWQYQTKDNDRLKQGYPEKYGPYKWDVSDMPRFVYRETWPQEQVQTAAIDIGVIVLWGLLFFLGAYIALLRYDLR